MGDFKFLLSVAKEALSYGDSGPAETLIKELASGIRTLEAITDPSVDQRIRLGDQKQKMTRVAKVVSTAPKKTVFILPTANNNPPQAYAAVRKSHRDPIQMMDLTAYQQYAASQIRWVFMETTRGMWPKNAPMSVDRVDSSTSMHDRFLAMSDNLINVRVNQYGPWVKRNQGVVVKTKKKIISRYDLVMTVIINEVSLRECSRHFQAKRSRLRGVFADALDDYM